MTNSTNNSIRLNSIEQIETALKCLTSHGYATEALWAEHKAWVDSLDARQPTDDDRKWASRSAKPVGMKDHFANGLPEVLTAAQAWEGRQYLLSPGQRDVLRERYGLTPSKVVEVVEVGMFAGTSIIHSITLKSALHVEEHKRKHVLSAVVISPAADFFSTAAAKDAARQDDSPLDEGDKPVKTKAEPKVKVQSMAMVYL